MSIIELKGLKTVPDIVHEYTPSIKGTAVPLIIDNGIDQSVNLMKVYSVKFGIFLVFRLIRVSRWLGMQ